MLRAGLDSSGCVGVAGEVDPVGTLLEELEEPEFVEDEEDGVDKNPTAPPIAAPIGPAIDPPTAAPIIVRPKLADPELDCDGVA